MGGGPVRLSAPIARRSARAPETELRDRLCDLAHERRRFGYRRLFIRLRRKGKLSGINRIYRLYSEEKLAVRMRHARRSGGHTRGDPSRDAPQCALVADFVHGQFACGRPFRALNIVDDATRECLAAIPSTSISGRRIRGNSPD